MSLENRPVTEDPVHIIYRLEGSLPSVILSRLREQLKQVRADLTTQLKELDPKARAERTIVQQSFQARLKEIQEKYDQYLDQIISGPAYLDAPDIAKLIIDSWRHLESRESLVIDAISVMPNHVHIQLSTNAPDVVVDSKALLAGHRRWTARLINQIRNTEGKKVWATPFFDRDVRWEAFGTVFWYILHNPIKAGLCADFRSWPGNYWRPELID